MEKCLVIDFDDTLVKTIEIHADSWRKALEKVLKIEIPLETILSDINYGMDVLLEKYQVFTVTDIFLSYLILKILKNFLDSKYCYIFIFINMVYFQLRLGHAYIKLHFFSNF